MKEERIASLVLVVFAAAYLLGTFFIPTPPLKQQMGPEVFPRVVGVLLLILAGIYTFQQFRGRSTEDETRAAIIGADEKLSGRVDLKTMGIMLALMVVYAVLFEPLGYAITTFLVFMAGVLYLDRRHLARDMVMAFIASFGLHLVFALLLRVQLPAGPLKFLGL